MTRDERARSIVAARDSEALAWKQIAARFGLSEGRARAIYKRQMYLDTTVDDGTIENARLTVRTVNALRRAGFGRHSTKADVLKNLDRLRRGERIKSPGPLRGFKQTTWRAIEQWLNDSNAPGKRLEDLSTS